MAPKLSTVLWVAGFTLPHENSGCIDPNVQASNDSANGQVWESEGSCLKDATNKAE